jgi:phosphoenolpyruvate synthase/pyruvate phosphate dikinase
MEKPEYVFPAVVVQFSFPAEKSGVMVTSDVDTGRSDWLTVAVSEGVGGAVEGQAAESLRIDRRTGEVLLLAQATAPRRAVLSLRGGIDRVPASGGEAVLEKHEITQLVRLANQVPERFPSLRTENGAAVPADIEFAFRDGRLALLQMRPFVENRSAQRNLYLASLDAGFGARGSEPVNLDTVPENPR